MLVDITTVLVGLQYTLFREINNKYKLGFITIAAALVDLRD